MKEPSGTPAAWWSENGRERSGGGIPKTPKKGRLDQINEYGRSTDHGCWNRSELVFCTREGEGRAEKTPTKEGHSVSLLSSVAPYLSPEKNWRPRRGAVGLDILELKVDMYRDVKKGW